VVNRGVGGLFRKNVPLLSAIGIAVIVGAIGFIIGTRADEIKARFDGFKNLSTSNTGHLDLNSVQQTYDALSENFDGELNAKKLIEGAKRGLVDAAGDPYTTYFSDEEAKQFKDDLEGQFSGIGAELDKKDNRIFVRSTIDDSPAKAAGLQSGDFIVKVNEQETTGWSIDKAVTNIRGEKGTTVKLTVLRNESELKEFSIVRDIITNPSVKTEITPENIGIMRISRFGESDTFNLVRKAAQEFKDKNVKGVIVDLRGNGGGYLDPAIDIAGVWLNDKVVTTERRGGKVIDTLKTENNAILEGVETIVLVDGSSASASEILAGALRDHKAAKLVGEKTFGKGSVQTFEDLAGGGQLKVTIAKWYTPNGINIHKEGIKPDVEVKVSEGDVSAGVDKQKDRAKELILQ
jgi:carboxyl-terminal processing protease